MPSARSTLLRHAAPWCLVRRAEIACVACVACVALAASSGCFYNNPGLSPPPEKIYYPTGLVVSPGHSALYVANSDFDLQYNGATVQAIDLIRARTSIIDILDGVRGSVQACTQPGAISCLKPVCNSIPVSSSVAPNGSPCTSPSDCQSGNCVYDSGLVSGSCRACKINKDCPSDYCDAAKGVCSLAVETNPILSPSACTALAPPFKARSAQSPGSGTVGAFASGAILAVDPDHSQGRLFVPVRGDPSITWFNVLDDTDGVPAHRDPLELDCGQSNGNLRCDDNHRLGVDPYDNFRDLTLPVEPVGLDVSSDGQFLVSAHQISGAPQVGLSVNTWGSGFRPTFEFSLGGIAAGPTDVAKIPAPRIVVASAATKTPIPYQPGFAVTYNAAPEIDIFRVNSDATSSPPRPYLARAFQGAVSVNATGTDSRGLVIDPSERTSCEDACVATDLSCLAGCVNTPLRVFIANRTPPSLLLGQVLTQVVSSDVNPGVGSGVFDSIQLYDSVALSTGPSKVALGQAINRVGQLQTFVFAVCFDTQRIFMIDPLQIDTANAVVAVIDTGRGPHAVAFDACSKVTSGTDEGLCKPPAAGLPVDYAFLYVGHFTDSYLGVVDLDMRKSTFGTMFASLGSPVLPVESQ